MAGIDHGNHPMRFAIAASTASGLLVALLTAAARQVLRSWMFWDDFLPWLLLPGWGLAALSLVLRARRREREPRRVFLIVAAFTHKHWVAQLIRDLHETLERRGYDLVLKIPDRDYSGVSQVRLLDGILSRRREYAGGFIMVNQAASIHADLSRFCGKARMPVVFIDAEAFDSEDAYPPGTAFVGCDDAQIGAVAGGWVAGYLRREHIKRPAVLVVNGGYYPQRERMFQKVLESAMPDVQFIGACGKFDRAQACEVARAHLRRLDADGRKLHAVFCANDEMALGVADAILFSGIPWARDTVVAGVDGTPDARALIEAGPSPLRATVVQDSYKVAEEAVASMERMIQKQPVRIRTLVAAEILSRN
jgi:ribose transport system substrate-binding protein